MQAVSSKQSAGKVRNSTKDFPSSSQLESESRKTGSIRIGNLLRDFDRMSKTSSVHASANKTPQEMVADEEKLRMMVFQKIMDMTPQQIMQMIEFLEAEQVEDDN